jgi:hypothetical protein
LKAARRDDAEMREVRSRLDAGLNLEREGCDRMVRSLASVHPTEPARSRNRVMDSDADGCDL